MCVWEPVGKRRTLWKQTQTVSGNCGDENRTDPALNESHMSVQSGRERDRGLNVSIRVVNWDAVVWLKTQALLRALALQLYISTAETRLHLQCANNNQSIWWYLDISRLTASADNSITCSINRHTLNKYLSPGFARSKFYWQLCQWIVIYFCLLFLTFLYHWISLEHYICQQTFYLFIRLKCIILNILSFINLLKQ